MTGRIVVLYDPTCAFCRAAARWLRRLDWRHRLDVAGIDGDFVLSDGRVLETSALMEALHVAEPGGNVFVGFFACRRLARALPALWPLVPVLYAPGIPRWGVRAYAWVARHRTLLARVLRTS